jgi:hypothetical protein
MFIAYHGRPMEIRTETAYRTALGGDAGRPGSKGIECDRLDVFLDLAPVQWTLAFPAWYSRVSGVPISLLRASEEVRVHGLTAWVYMGARADSTGRSRYWRVYLIPRGRRALVVRSIGWQPSDADLFASQLDQAAAEADIS